MGRRGEGMGGRPSQPEPFTGTQRRTMTLRWEVLISTCNRMFLDVLPWEPKCDVLPWRPDAQKGGYIQLMTMGAIYEENESDWSQNVQLNSNNCSVT